MLQELGGKLLRLTKNATMYGINVPMVKDPKTGIGSVSLTLVFISSVMVILGLVGKWSGHLGTIDIHNALEFFYASSALYFGRNWKSKDNSLTTPGGAPADEIGGNPQPPAGPGK